MDFSKLIESRTLLVFLVLTAVFILISAVLIYTNIDNLSFPLILHFNDYEGADLVGEAQDLWNLLIMEGVVVLINIFLGALLYKRERVLTYVVLATNVLITFLGLIAVANIISLN